MKKRWVAAVLAGMITGAVLLSGCGGSSSAADSAGQEAAGADQQAGQEAENTGAAGTEAASETASESVSAQVPAEEMETLKVGMLGQDMKTACVIMAKELGLFEEEGVDVQFEKVSNLAEGITAVSEGKLDILPYGAIPTLSFASQGADVCVFGGTISEGSECVTLPENADLYKEAEDFRGKKIGCFRMETGHMVMKGYLREHGLEPDVDVQYVYLDSQASIAEAVKKGEVDLGFVNSGFGYVAEGNGLKVAFHAGDFVEGFPCCRQSTSGKTLAEKKDALVKFEIAALRAYEIYLNDHAKTIELLSAYSGQDAAYTEAVMYGTDTYRNAMTVSLNPNKKKVLDFYETMKLNGDIDANTPVDMADHIDTTVYETALQTLADREADNTLWQDLMQEAKETN